MSPQCPNLGLHQLAPPAKPAGAGGQPTSPGCSEAVTAPPDCLETLGHAEELAPEVPDKSCKGRI